MGAVTKAARALGHALAGWFTIAWRFPSMTEAQRQARVQAWAAGMLRIMGIEVQVSGTPPATGPMLLVANHISWLDILVMHAARHCRFIAKSDVKHWPLVGALATGGGTLYIERASRRDAMRVVHHMVERLLAGEVLAVFPEGTTTDGTRVLPFHGNLVQAAISAHVPVQPMALRYVDAGTGAPSLAASYVDDDSLLGSVWRTLTAPRIRALVVFGEPQLAQGRDRRAWAHDLHDAVDVLRQRS
jgi:1-acyl-sn-glycerol-3-phosphate acyltransferase